MLGSDGNLPRFLALLSLSSSLFIQTRRKFPIFYILFFVIPTQPVVRLEVDPKMTSSPVLVVAIGAATYVFLSALLRFTQDPMEPPAIETSVPFISPLFGMLSGMQSYVVKMRSVIQRYGLTSTVT